MLNTQPSEPWFSSLPIAAFAETFGTPFYLYHLPTLRNQAKRIKQAFGPQVELYYALKANPNPILLYHMRKEALVDGVDVASTGEIRLALKAGWDAQKLSYAGPGKRLEDLQMALQSGVGTISIESLEELDWLCKLSQDMPDHPPPSVMMRINPTQIFHAFGVKISGRPGPFGIDEDALDDAIAALKRAQPRIHFAGVHVHAGSQCLNAKAMTLCIQNTLEIAERIHQSGLSVHSINLGGGFGVANWSPPQSLGVGSVARDLQETLDLAHARGFSPTLRIEPGRYLFAESGLYVARVTRLKESQGRTFCIVDGGVHHFFALTEHDAQQKSRWVENLSRPQDPHHTVQICGPLCTPQDRLASDIRLPKPQEGDLLAWPNAGSYGLTASPFGFLSHPSPPELLFDGETIHCIRPRFYPEELLLSGIDFDFSL